MIVTKSSIFTKLERAVVVLHGYGSCGEDFKTPVTQVMGNCLANTLFAFPDAPYGCQAGFGLEWFPLSNEMTYNELRSGLNLAAPALFKDVIQKIAENYSIACSQINIIGFSQGAMLALEMMYYADFSHIISYSGVFAFDPDQRLSFKNNKVLLVHGDIDSVVPVNNVQKTAADLDTLGVKHEELICHGLGHTISAEGLKKGSGFIANPVRI